MRKFFQLIFHKVLGWKEKIDITLPSKCVICIAPHTSNWDFIIGELFIHEYGWKAHFMMKKDWFFWPLGPILKRMGGIPIDRSHKTSTVEQMIEMFKQRQIFHLGITPEGTRKANPNWKKGFYYIAQGANVPIVLIAIDYPSKSIIAEKVIEPCGDIEKDTRIIKDYFSVWTGKYPQNFVIE